MLSWVVTFLIIALIAGILGFGGIAGASVEIAKIIFFIAILLGCHRAGAWPHPRLAPVRFLIEPEPKLQFCVLAGFLAPPIDRHFA
jgi:uncharacterized membrane protein YtjA (UPF0391 family)